MVARVAIDSRVGRRVISFGFVRVYGLRYKPTHHLTEV